MYNFLKINSEEIFGFKVGINVTTELVNRSGDFKGRS
jgi:hypothetical protein